MIVKKVLDKKTTSLLIMALLIAATFGAVVLVKRIQETRRGATGNAVNITFSPSSGNYQIGDEFDVTVIGTPPSGKALGAFMLTVTFDENRLEVVGGENGITALQASLPQKTLNANQGTISIQGMMTSSSLNATNLFRIRFKAKAGGGAQLALEQGGQAGICSLSGNQCDESTVQDVGITFETATFNLSGATPTPDRIQSVSLDPSQGSFQLNNEFTVLVKVNIGSNGSKGAELIFDFDKDKLQVVDIDSQIFNTLGKQLGNDNGRARVLLTLSTSNSPPTGELEVARFRLKGKQVGAVVFTPSKIQLTGGSTGSEWTEDAVISGLQGQYTITSGVVPTVTSTPPTPTLPPGVTPTVAPTNTPAPTLPPATATPTEIPDENTPILSFQVKFSRVTYEIDDQKVVVKVRKGNLQEEFEGVDVVADNEGVLSGEVALTNIAPGSGYSIIIKGPKHLATRFCQNEQEDRCLGEGSIALVAGENTFDFTGMPLLAGDIPDDNNLQNGIVDIDDFGRLKRAIVATDEDLRNRCNLDFDKDSDGKDVISGRDITLYLNTLSQRYDEDY